MLPVDAVSCTDDIPRIVDGPATNVGPVGQQALTPLQGDLEGELANLG